MQPRQMGNSFYSAKGQRVFVFCCSLVMYDLSARTFSYSFLFFPARAGFLGFEMEDVQALCTLHKCHPSVDDPVIAFVARTRRLFF